MRDAGDTSGLRDQFVTQSSVASASARIAEIPLLIGVVGHRDLVPDEIPFIREAVTGLLRALMDAGPDVPIKLLSAQAEGADLVVAEVAQRLGIGIIALLPFAESQCRADLTSDAARAAFDLTMPGAEKLELKPAPATEERQSTRAGEQRDRQFERAGELIAQHSSLLIVIWDGVETAHRAGTARTVQQRRGQNSAPDEHLPDRPRVELYASADNDLMYEIRCSRLGSAQSQYAASASVIGFVGSDTNHGGIERGIPPVFALQIARTAEFNRDVHEFGERIVTHGRPLVSDGGPPASGALSYLSQLFAASDWLALHFGRCFRRALALRFSLWALMAYLLLAFKHSPDGVRGLATITAVLLVFVQGWLLAYWARRRCWDRRYLDYRALAEGLRVDFYWELSGVRTRFDDAFAHEGFLQKQDAQIEWMRAAMRTVNLRCALLPHVSAAGGFDHALASWVGDPSAPGGSGQLVYYRQRTASLERRLRVAEHVSRGMLLGGLALALILGADVALRLLSLTPVLAPAPRGVLLMSLALLTAYTAIFEVYLAERADRSLARQYRHMDALFSTAAQRLRSARSTAEKLDILRALGHACLTEHAQWILAHRDKRIDGLRW